MCETEDLILQVKSHKCLWKVDDISYNDRNAKKTSWQKVASTLYYYDWLRAEDKTKKSRIADLQKRWKNVKDYYRRQKRHEKSIKSGASAPKKKKYTFSDILRFLDGHLDQKIVCNDVVDITADTSDEESIDSSLTQNKNSPLQIIEYGASSIKNEISPMVTDDANNWPAHHNDMSTEREKQFYQSLQLLAQEKEEQSEADEIDEDKYFLLSFLPSLKRLNDLEKLDFKIQVMELLRNVRLQNSP